MALTGPLKCWLLDETSDRTAIETIAKSAILSREARAVLPELKEAALRPATADEIKAIIGQRFALFPQPKRNEGEWAAWWADYLDALDGLTPYAVEAGMAAWVRSPEAEFMCKPGKLADLAKGAPNNNRWARAHHRATMATKVEEPKPAPEVIEAAKPSPEEMAEVMADFKSRMEEINARSVLERTKARRRPSPQASVDERGVSPEMRKLLARNQAQPW